MKLITKYTDYAIKAICYIARDEKGVFTVEELSGKLKIPRAFLRKILLVLNKKGILQSYKGRGGGFRLSIPANKIFITDLIKVFQGPVKLSECFFRKRICPDIKTCRLKKKINKIEKYVVAELKCITIESLL